MTFAPVYEEFVDYLVKEATPQTILALKVSDEAQARARDLLERNNADTLSPEEQAELEQMRLFDLLVSMLKARALEALEQA